MDTGLCEPFEFAHFETGTPITMHDAFNILRRYVFVFEIPGIEGFGSVYHLEYKCLGGLDSDGDSSGSPPSAAQGY
jgi:hypothetical protein